MQQKSPAAKRVEPAAREQLQSRPAPAALQEVVDRPSVGRSRPQAAPVSEPLQLEPARIQPSFTLRQEEPLRVEEPIQEPSQPILPARLTPIRIQPQPVTLPPSPQTERPSRLGVRKNIFNFLILYLFLIFSCCQADQILEVHSDHHRQPPQQLQKHPLLDQGHSQGKQVKTNSPLY